ncbi:HAD-superfamily hydrolase, subfamily IA, variant 1 [Renibacterium salmoninarum ATCC 33209]|uniref:HAD-superfamily hydrolase, subfamily IA, variant 1 n=2 Tax=Renibacterium salmoninarum TaxID=1646 RepID=A9WQZ4_RENSM|nr:HAD-superfamily hydrolase, subfamily IA, variant 1 [Renibacterium salmoninarum ATCC 33209]
MDMSLGLGSWVQAKAAGVDVETIDKLRIARDTNYQQYLRTEQIEIHGVLDALPELSRHVRIAIVTTSKRADFELIHERRRIRDFMEFVLVREDYKLAKPQPDPYLAGLSRFGASRDETLVVEDSARGLRSAIAAGLDCVIVHNEFTSSHDFSEANARIQLLSELNDLVLNWHP